MIILPNIDGKIWHAEHKVIEIVQHLKKYGRAEIDIDREGGDCKSLGLYDILDSICQNLGVLPQQITIHTCNQLEQHDQYNIVKHPPLYIDSGQKFAKNNTMSEKNWNTLKHFGLFVGRSSWQRLWLASHLWHHHRDAVELTYHYDFHLDYHRLHLGFDELCFQSSNTTTISQAADFLKHLPIINDEVDRYPILTPAHFSIAKLYPNFAIELVCETFLLGNSFYPTEKTWRPLICRTPFLTLGPKNFLQNLKKLGFRTFDQWWDESYDQDADLDNGRVAIRSILDTTDRLSKMTQSDLEAMLIDMHDTVEHNYQNFMQLRSQDFKKIWP